MDYWMMPMLMPRIPSNNMKPPTVYAILESICNYDKDESERTRIRDLAKVGRTKIFDFDYPLTDNIDREKFETMILNHYIYRRIGFQTITAWKIQLETKLNEIMPLYNMMFDSIQGWNLFRDGGVITHDATNDGSANSSSKQTNKSNTISDSRNSDLPQSKIQDVQDGSYLSDYSYNTGNDNSESNGTSESNNKNIMHVTTTTIPDNRVELYKAFQSGIKNIYSMIFKELDELFYDIIN